MKRILLTFLLIITLSITIAFPFYISICEINCEISLTLDLDEEIEDIEIIKYSQFKISPNFNTSFKYAHNINQSNVVFVTEEYKDVFQKLESPPPDSHL